MLGVSRPTLREALRVLEFLGIATVAPRRGILINQPRDSEGYLPLLSVLLFERITDRELFELRQALQIEAVGTPPNAAVPNKPPSSTKSISGSNRF